MGSFNANGRRYSLMTMEALEASRLDTGSGRRPDIDMPISDTEVVYLDNSMHAIQPIPDDETSSPLDDDGRCCRHRLPSVYLFIYLLINVFIYYKIVREVRDRQSCSKNSKNIDILALEMASTGNRHCANCIGTLSFPVVYRWPQSHEGGRARLPGNGSSSVTCCEV